MTTTTPTGGGRALRRRAAWGTLDQLLSSATNVALGIVVARSVSVGHFGAFSAVYLTYILLGLLSRAASSEVLVVRYSASAPSVQRRGVQVSVGTALLTGVAGAVVCVIAALLTEDVLRGGFLALAACMPGLFVQDAWRFAFLAQGRPAAAAWNDLVWALVQFSALALIAATGDVSVVAAIMAWGLGAYVCSALGGLQARVFPAPGGFRWWWASHRDLIPRFVAEHALARGSGQLAFFLVAAVTSLVTFAVLRAGNLLLGPLNVLFGSVALVAVPEAVRLNQRAPGRVRRLCAMSAAAMAATSLLVGVAFTAVPDDVGRLFLGDSWFGARKVLIPLSLAAAALATQMAALIGLRAMELARHSLAARLAVVPVRLVLAPAGAALGGASGAAWALALAETVGAVVHWRQLVRGAAQALEHHAGNATDSLSAAPLSERPGVPVGVEGVGPTRAEGPAAGVPW